MEVFMIQLVAPDWYSAFADEIREMHRLRYRAFKERLSWDVHTKEGLEADVFDELKPHYLLLRGPTGSIEGCVRLLPSTGPTMLRDVFPSLLQDRAVPADPTIWESSRFALDQAADTSKGPNSLAAGTYELFAGMIEFGLSISLSRIVTVTDLRVERILRRAGWPLQRIGDPQTIGKTRAVAGYLQVSADHLDAVRNNGEISSPVLWAPVASAVA